MARILRSAHLSGDKKSARLELVEAHLDKARAECKLYNDQIGQCKEENTDVNAPSTMHYSFDHTQQVHFPNNRSNLDRHIYFLKVRPGQCQLFGIACEPIGVQANYSIDEGETIGKCANATISILHHFQEEHTMQEANLLLHADNCVGQNKNNAPIHYFMWLVATERCQSVQLFFMLPGCTQFFTDYHFEIVKKAYCQTRYCIKYSKSGRKFIYMWSQQGSIDSKCRWHHSSELL